MDRRTALAAEASGEDVAAVAFVLDCKYVDAERANR